MFQSRVSRNVLRRVAPVAAVGPLSVGGLPAPLPRVHAGAFTQLDQSLRVSSGAMPCRCFASRASHAAPLDEAKVINAYRTLGLTIGADAPTIRQQYLSLAKQLHPDVVRDQSVVHPRGLEFTHVQEAYNYLSSLHADILARAKQDAERRSRGEAPLAESSSGPVPNAAHSNTVQHRTYLRNEGIGHGLNPMQRDKQYRTHRATYGREAAIDYRNSKLAMPGEQHNSKDGPNELAAYDSLLAATRATHFSGRTTASEQATFVEEQIKKAMSEWDVSTFKDFGKPLSHITIESGSMVDPLEAKLNKMMHENGVVPEFLDLERRITSEYAASIGELLFVWNELVTRPEYEQGRREIEQDPALRNWAPLFPQSSQPLPSFASPFGRCWSLAVSEFHSSLCYLNSSIDDYNVALPRNLQRQRLHFEFWQTIRDIESEPPNDTLRNLYTVRERDSSILALRRGRTAKNLLGSSRIIATLAGDDAGTALRTSHITDPFAPSSSSAASTSEPVDMEELYRSLSPAPRDRRSEAEKAASVRQARKSRLPVSPGVLILLAAASALVFILPVWWLTKRDRERREHNRREFEGELAAAATLAEREAAEQLHPPAASSDFARH